MRLLLLPCIYIVSSPPFFPLDLETDDDALVIDYFTVEDLALAIKQTGKHPHFDHAYIAYSLLSYACIRIAAATALPILMHSLFIVSCYCYLPVILNCLA
jgi:hypothetical protein